MPRNMNFPRGRVDVQCLDCEAIYEFSNHESWYVPGLSDACPFCGACRYKRVWVSNPMMWGINPEWERWHKTLRDPLETPNREPITRSKAWAYAAVHQRNTGESVTPDDILKEVNTRYYGFQG